MYDIITVGSSTLDVFAEADFSELITIREPHHKSKLIAFPSGSKILINHLEFTLGGGGTNTAFAMKRLGLKVAYLGKIGDDLSAQVIKQELAKEKVHHICTHCKGRSGYSIILNNLEKDRTILTYKGVNNDFSYDEISKRKLKTKWFYFSAMVGEGFKTLEKLADFAQEKGIKIAFNPSSYLAERGPKFLKKIISKTNVLIVNNEEAQLISEQEKMSDKLHTLHQMGPDIVIVTNGHRAMHACDKKVHYTSTPPRIKVVDATGAGDSFASGVVASLIKGKPLDHALKIGMANSQSVISYYGAKNYLLSYKEAVAMAKKMKIVVKKKKVRKKKSS